MTAKLGATAGPGYTEGRSGSYSAWRLVSGAASCFSPPSAVDGRPGDTSVVYRDGRSPCPAWLPACTGSQLARRRFSSHRARCGVRPRHRSSAAVVVGDFHEPRQDMQPGPAVGSRRATPPCFAAMGQSTSWAVTSKTAPPRVGGQIVEHACANVI